jgi:hypothetical protein
MVPVIKARGRGHILPTTQYIADLSVKEGDDILTAYNRLYDFIARNQPDACDYAMIDYGSDSGVQISSQDPAAPTLPFVISIVPKDGSIQAYISLGKINGKYFVPESGDLKSQIDKTIKGGVFKCENEYDKQYGAISATGQVAASGDAGIFLKVTAKETTSEGRTSTEMSGKIEIKQIPVPQENRKDVGWYMLAYIDDNQMLYQLTRGNLRVDAVKIKNTKGDYMFFFSTL